MRLNFLLLVPTLRVGTHVRTLRVPPREGPRRDAECVLGHTSTEMVMRHYSQIAGKIDHMRDAAMKAANAG